MTRLAALAVVAVLVYASAARADVPAELRGRPVVAVELGSEESALVSPDSVGIAVGTPLTRELVRDAVMRLVAGGRATDVQIDAIADGEGVRLLVHVVPRVVLARIEIDGNEVLDDEEASRIMQIAAGAEISTEDLTHARDTLATAYAERGYPVVRTSIVLRDTDDPARKVLVATIDEGAPERLARVRFAGDAPPDDVVSAVLSALGLSRGDVIDRRRIDEGLRAADRVLHERGWLAGSLGPARVVSGGDGPVLEIASHIGPRYTVVVRGRGPIPRDTLLSALHLGDEPLGGPAGDRAIEHAVQETYGKAGFLDARVRILHEPGAHAGDERLVVDVTAGPQVGVDRIDFPGAHHFDASFLRDQVSSYLEEDIQGSTLFFPVDSEEADAAGAGGESVRRRRTQAPPLVVRPARVYWEPTYAEAVRHIGDLYQAGGYLSARVGPARFERIDSTHGRVYVDVVEGPRTLLWDVRFRGNHVVGDHALADAARLERGGPFSYLALEEARVRMTDAFKEKGYLYARIEPTTRISSDGTRAEVTFDVIERFEVRVHGMTVRGLTHTSQAVVEGLVSLHDGDLFRPSEMRASEERLLDLGVFSGATIAPEADDLPAREKRVVVTVHERSSQYLDTHLGLSSGQGARGGLEYGYRDLAGTAMTLVFGANLGYQFLLTEPQIQDYYDALSALDRLERRITARLTAPYVPGLPGVRASLELAHVRHNELQFGYDKNSVVFSLAWRPVRAVTVTASEQLEENNLGLFGGQDLANLRTQLADDPRLSKLLRVPNGESTLLSTRATIAVDLRDSPFTPTRGVFGLLSAEWARSLDTTMLPSGDQFFSNLLKLSFTASGYVPVFTPEVVFAVQFRIGGIFSLENGAQTYPDRQFFLGGVDSMRGYLQDALIPEELAAALARDTSGRASPSAAPRGGDAFVLLRGELRFPIAGPLHGGVFVDIGNLWADVKDFDLTQLRPTAGLGLRIATPVGPLAFDYGFVLFRRSLPLTSCLATPGGVASCAHDEPFEPVGSFHFSIGLF